MLSTGKELNQLQDNDLNEITLQYYNQNFDVSFKVFNHNLKTLLINERKISLQYPSSRQKFESSSVPVEVEKCRRQNFESIPNYHLREENAKLLMATNLLIEPF